MSDAAAILQPGERVAVICGGTGSEREVSLVSGKSVAEAVESIGLPLDFFELETDNLPQALDPGCHLVLPLVHGRYGEDGRLSAELDAGGFSYGGCQQASSELCFDKLRTKDVARELGIPVARDIILSPDDRPAYESISEALGIPFILKPVRDGSSVGLHLVTGRDDYSAIAGDLRKTDYLAEAYQEGYDLTVGVLEEEPMGVIGVHPEGKLYDYAHKYTKGLSTYDVPARIAPALSDQLRDWSGQIFSSCGCRDLARVDFHMGADGQVRFLEVNTIPGMTPTSLLPKSASCCDFSFRKLVQRWLELVANRKVREACV